MDQNQNDLFDNDNQPPQQPDNEPTQMGGGARVYQTPPGVTPEEPRPYIPPSGAQTYAQPPKKKNTALIIGIVVAVLLCCCCLALLAIAWFYGDTLFQDFTLAPVRYLLV